MADSDETSGGIERDGETVRDKFVRRGRQALMRTLRRKLAWRLGVAALAISALVGAGVWRIKALETQNRIVEFGRRKADEHWAQLPALLQAPERRTTDSLKSLLLPLLGRTAAHKEGRFVYGALYDIDGTQLAQAADPEFERLDELQNNWDRSPGRFNKAAPLWSSRLPLANSVILQMLHQLHEHPDGSGELIGYVEGAYQVHPDTVDRIQRDILRSVLATMAVVLATALVLYPVILALGRGLVTLSSNLLKSHFEVLAVLAGATGKRDNDTARHNFRVTIMAVHLAERAGLDPREIAALFKGALVHDVGKIGVPDAILLKPDRLTDREYLDMRQHVRYGWEIVSGSPWLADAADVVRYHHERYDGKGYLEGLAGDRIPVAARVFAIVDVFDALASARPYKESHSFEETMKVLTEGRGSHFDPALLDCFQSIAEPLYQDLIAADNARIEEQLQRIAEKYFIEPEPVLAF